MPNTASSRWIPFHSLAAQNVHPHRGLAVTAIRLDLSSETTEVSYGLLEIAFGIQQRGDERHLAWPEATLTCPPEPGPV